MLMKSRALARDDVKENGHPKKLKGHSTLTLIIDPGFFNSAKKTSGFNYACITH